MYHRWRGDAPVTNEITELLFDRLVPGGVYGLKAWNVPLMQVVAEPGMTLATVQTNLLAKLQAAGYSISGQRVTGQNGLSTGLRVVGTPGCFVQTLRAAVTPTGKQVRVTLPRSTTGGTFDLSFNFGAGVETASLDADTATSTKEDDIESLTTPGSGDVRVSLAGTSPLSYLISTEGSLIGNNWTVTGDGAGLYGTGTCEITTIQSAGDQAKEVQVIWLPPFLLTAGTLYMRIVNGGTKSNWASPINAAESSGTPATLVQKAVNQACGIGKWTTTLVYRQNFGGCLVLKADTNEAWDPVTAVLRYVPAGMAGPSGTLDSDGLLQTYDSSDNPPGLYSGPSTSAETVREFGSSESEVVAIDQCDTDSVSISYAFDGGTASINSHATESSLQSSWNSLAGSGATVVFGNPEASGTYGTGIYLVKFAGSRANADQPAITLDGSGTGVTTIIEGRALLNQKTQIILTADSGTLKFSGDGGTNKTSALTFGFSASSLDTALEGLAAFGSGNLTCSGSGTRANPYIVEGTGGLASTAFTLTAHDVALNGGFDPTIQVIAEAVTGVHQQDEILLDRNRNGGHVTPLVGGLPGNRVAYNGNAAAWEAAIEAVTSSGCTVTLAGADSFLVDWDDYASRLLTLNQSFLTVSESSLITLRRIQEATGPNRWNDPRNWSSNAVPGHGDTVILRDGQSSILDGLTQRSSWVRDTRTNDLLLGTNVDDSPDFAVGQVLRLSKSSGGTFPSATLGGSSHTLSDATDYYVVSFDKFNRRLSISTTAGGEAIEVTNSGTGTFEVFCTLAAVDVHSTWQGQLGWTRVLNALGPQERPRWLKVGITTLQLGLESGPASNLCCFDLGAVTSQVRVYHSGSTPAEGEYAVQIQANGDTTDVEVTGGEVALGPTDHGDTESLFGDVKGVNCRMMCGQISVSTLNLQGVSVEAPYGVTVRADRGLVVKA